MKKPPNSRKRMQNQKRGIRRNNRGRSSGAAISKANYHQTKLINEGYANIHHLLYNLIKNP